MKKRMFDITDLFTFILLAFGLVFYFRKYPGTWIIVVLNLLIFFIRKINRKPYFDTNILFPQVVFLNKPSYLLVFHVAFGALPSLISGRIFSFTMVHHNILNIIIVPLFIFSILMYIIKIQKHAKLDKQVINSINTELSNISSMILPIILIGALLFSAYNPNSDLFSNLATYRIAQWINIAYMTFTFYVIVMSTVIIIRILQILKKGNIQKINYRYVFPTIPYIMFCLFSVFFGLSFIFSGHRLEITFELSWVINLALFISLSYEVLLIPNTTVPEIVPRFKLNLHHAVIILSVLVSCYGIIIRYFEMQRFVAIKDIPNLVEFTGLIVIFIIMSLLVLNYYLSLTRTKRNTKTDGNFKI